MVPKKPKVIKPVQLPESLQVCIALYLTEIRRYAESGIAACTTMEAAAPHLPGTSGNKAYWIGIAQGIDYCISRLHHKHQYTVDVQLMDPCAKIKEGLIWSDVQAKMGVSQIWEEILPHSVMEGQSTATSTPTTEQKAEVEQSIERQSHASNGNGKAFEIKSLEPSSDTQSESLPSPKPLASVRPTRSRKKATS